jgi:hypothetical protein
MEFDTDVWRGRRRAPPVASFWLEARCKGGVMRLVAASLIVIAVLYFWDKEYNNGRLLDGLDNMRRSVSHHMFP